MFSADQISRFAGLVSQARFQAFPCRIVFRGREVQGSCTGLKTGRTLGAGGFTFTHDAVVRLPLAVALPPDAPAVGEQITLFMPGLPAAGQTLRIAAPVVVHPNNPEWCFGIARL